MSDFCVVVQNFSCSNYLSTIYIDSFFFFINQWISHQAGDYGRGTIVISKIHLSISLFIKRKYFVLHKKCKWRRKSLSLTIPIMTCFVGILMFTGSFVIRIKAWWAFARRVNYPNEPFLCLVCSTTLSHECPVLCYDSRL